MLDKIPPIIFIFSTVAHDRIANSKRGSHVPYVHDKKLARMQSWLREVANGQYRTAVNILACYGLTDLTLSLQSVGSPPNVCAFK